MFMFFVFFCTNSTINILTLKTTKDLFSLLSLDPPVSIIVRPQHLVVERFYLLTCDHSKAPRRPLCEISKLISWSVHISHHAQIYQTFYMRDQLTPSEIKHFKRNFKPKVQSSRGVHKKRCRHVPLQNGGGLFHWEGWPGTQLMMTSPISS